VANYYLFRYSENLLREIGTEGYKSMREKSVKLYIRLQSTMQVLKSEEGQDLVEYALVIAVVCLGIISGMTTLANGINTAMSTLASNLNTAMA
jgi:pilus assembly protein Flp/PilA